MGEMNLEKRIQNQIAQLNNEEGEHDHQTNRLSDHVSFCKLVNAMTRADFQKYANAFITDETTPAELENVIRSSERGDMAKLKAEKKEAKKRRQKEKRKAEKAADTHCDKPHEASSNSSTSVDSDVTATAHGTETVEESKDESLGCIDEEMHSDDECLDLDAAFVKVCVKRNKNTVLSKSSVPKPEKVKPPLNSITTKPMAESVQSKNTKSNSNIAVTLGMQSCYLALNNNEFIGAIDCLSQAISFGPYDVRHFLNRSYCYLRIGEYSLALDDAQHAKKISKSPEDFAKGVAREAQALCGLQRYHEAEKCFEEILKLGHRSRWIVMELILARVCQLTNMGFSKINALKALDQCSSVVDAVALMTSGDMSAGLEVDTNSNKSESYNCEGDEIYYSDEEASNTILLSRIVSNITDESRYAENLQSLPSSSKSQQCANNLDMNSNSNKAMESLHHSNDRIHSNGNIQWQTTTSSKSVAGSSKAQMQKPSTSDSSSIWVGSIDKSITDHQLRQLFGVFGKIEYIRRFPDERNYVFIDFSNKRAASKALNNANPLQINGINIPVRPTLGFHGKK